jgi:hypothetical protein
MTGSKSVLGLHQNNCKHECGNREKPMDEIKFASDFDECRYIETEEELEMCHRFITCRKETDKEK